MKTQVLFLRQWISVLLAFFTGSSGTLAFSPYDFWPFAIISLTGLLIVTLNKNFWQTVWLGFIWGLGLFGTGISWIYISIDQFSGLSSQVNIILLIIFVIYLALYSMLFSVLLTILFPNIDIFRLIIGAPSLWTVTEFLRGWVLTGFSWLEFGYSQIDSPLKYIAPILGERGITFILVIISGLVVLALIQQRLLPILGILSVIFFSWSLSSLHWYNFNLKKTIDIALVQGNIAPSIRWSPNQIISIIDVYLHNTLPILDKVQLVVWPESAIPGGNNIIQNNFFTILDQKIKRTHTNLITGIIDARVNSCGGYNYYNSIVALGEKIPYCYPSLVRYDKYHLVPFGETVPLAIFLKPLSLIFNIPISLLNQGKYLQPQLEVSGMKITATICYEITQGSQVRDNFRSDTDFLLTLSNDAWFGRSIGPWQHFQMARMRSLELGRPLICSSNNGITAVVNADGTIKSQLPQFINGVLNVRIIPTRGTTPYAILGYLPLNIVTTLIIFISLINNRYRLFKAYLL